MSIAHIDGDICCFAVASACEGKRYRYKGEVFDSKLTLNKVLKDDGVDDNSVEFFSEPEEWDKVKESAVSYLENNVIGKLDMDYKIHLSGKGNFRYQVATIQPYKGNRDSIARPVHLDAVRQFYVDVYNAEVSVGEEADDAIGKATVVGIDTIATIDKDLNCIPGRHYNWMHDEIYEVSEVEADQHFYSQVLTGDTTDNILGLFGVGKDSKMVKLVKCMTDSREMFDYVRDQYHKRFGSYGDKFFAETCTLVWIRQQREPSWEKYLAEIKTI